VKAMIKVEQMDTWGFEHAVRGMRNPRNSWDKSDSFWCDYGSNCYDECDPVCERCTFHKTDDDKTRFADWNIKEPYYVIGKNDLELMRKLIKAGQSHRKFLRQIFISMDITAPLYWWKEFDTYKVGTVANSCSSMHHIHEKKFTFDDFSCEHLGANEMNVLKCIVSMLNINRNDYLAKEDKNNWWQIIQLLPSSYNQKRTVTMSYENVFNIIEQRTGHKLDEWRMFIEVLKGLPYMNELIK